MRATALTRSRPRAAASAGFSRVAEVPTPAQPPKLLDRVKWHLRVKRYSIRTERAYLDWIRRFILFHGKRHPIEMGEEEIAAFLSDLNIRQHVSASTQNQAFYPVR